MEIKTIQDAKELLWSHQHKITWIESSAFLIYFLWIFLSDFEMIVYKDSLDTDLLKKHYKIKSLNTLIPWKIWRLSVLHDKDIQNYLLQQKRKYIITRKETMDMEELVTSLWMKLLGNKSTIRAQYENKKTFRDILKEMDIIPILGENIPIDSFLASWYDIWASRYWEKIVIQLPDITKWWGSWTLFINNTTDFIAFQKKISDKTYKWKDISSINITTFISGISWSIIGCVTRYGTLTNAIQTQIIDIPEVISSKKWSWLFCWHDWGFKHYSSTIQKKADTIVQKIWGHMFKNGYTWIFWLDLIIDEHHNEVYIVECNSRYTWALPLLSMLDMQANNLPMDVFHLLEHLNIDYSMDFDTINQAYKNKKNGSHIILSNKQEEHIMCKKELPSWVYIHKNHELIFQREGYSYADIQNEHEFIITDWNPKKWQIIKWYTESCRICHLLFSSSILETHHNLKKHVKEIIASIYKELF